jgi:hypothetical protein
MTFIPNSYRYSIGDYCVNIRILRRPDGRFTAGHVFIITDVHNIDDDKRTISVCLMDKDERILCHIDVNDIAPHVIQPNECIKKYSEGDFVRMTQAVLIQIPDNGILYSINVGQIMLIVERSTNCHPPIFKLIDPSEPDVNVQCTNAVFVPAELRRTNLK